MTETSAEEQTDVRRELESLAARTRVEAALGQPENPFTRFVAGIEARARADEQARDAATTGEDRRVAAGGRPHRLEHETRDEWLARLDAWQKTPAGREWIAKEAKGEQERTDSARREAWPKVVEETGVPTLLAELVAKGNLQPTDPLVALRNSPFRILVLAGKIGTGKSVAAAWWLLEPYLPGAPVARARAAPSLWLSAARLARWDRYDDREMSRVLRAHRLVIDDLYAEFADVKGAFKSMLDEVVNDRLSNGRPIVITTNASKEDFKERYEGRIADRIREHGRFHASSGESMRGRRA